MLGYIIYEDTEGKKDYINRHIQYMKEKGVQLELVMLDELRYKHTPDFAIMRAIAPNVSKSLENKGVRVFNNSLVSEICNDKLKTYLLMKENGITYPTLYKKTEEITQYPVVVKSRNGHGGTEVFKADNRDEAERYLHRLEGRGIIQQFVDTPGKDLRVYVIGDKIVGAMLRKSTTDFRSNFCLGGSASVYKLSKSEEELTKRISSLLKFDYVGIDFIFHRGKIIFNEIEDVVGSRMLYTYTDIDIVKIYVDYILKEMKWIF